MRLLLVLYISPVFTMSFRSSTNQNAEDAYCLSPGCVKAAARVIQYMDKDKDPCTDFYEFACGTFIKETIIPDSKTSIGHYHSIAKDKLNERLRRLFEGESSAGSPKVFQSVRKFYESCMDKEHVEKVGKQAILEKVNKLGGWPVLEGKGLEAGIFAWERLAEKANRLGFSSGKVIFTSISPNSDDSTQRMIEIDQASLGLSRENLIRGLENNVVQAYLKYMVDSVVYLGADQVVAEEQMLKALKVELKLAEISSSKEERRNKTALNNHMRVEEISELFPHINWLDHINQFLDSQEMSITKEEEVNVASPDFLKELAEYLPTVDNRDLKNYMIWRYVKDMMPYSDKEARAILLEYNRVLTGKETEPPRWETCVKSVAGLDDNFLYMYEGSLSNAVGSMYAKAYFPASSKVIADEIGQNIREEFKIALDQLSWMDDLTREQAHIKLDKMKSFIAYAEEILDDSKINQYYQDFELDSPIYLNNLLTLKKFIGDYYVKELRNPIDKHSWKTHGGAGIMSAYYQSTENTITIPAGILDDVFFQSDRPSYMNYGTIGMVFGHEITHGFDDQGSQRDGDGNLVNWWEPATKKNYLERARCIVEQYGNYSVDIRGEDLGLNGINTQGENIADNGGLKAARRAYERFTSDHGKEPRLPGLTYTSNQLFWMANANQWCNVIRPEALKQYVLTDPHSPGRFRVNGVLRNLAEFAEDWNCPLGSPMNPEHKCSVW